MLAVRFVWRVYLIAIWFFSLVCVYSRLKYVIRFIQSMKWEMRGGNERDREKWTLLEDVSSGFQDSLKHHHASLYDALQH